MMQRNTRRHDEAHLVFIRQLPCLICNDNTSTEAAHVRFSDARIAKVNPGNSAKPHDKFTLPLCGDCHRAQHTKGNERKFWEAVGIDPVLTSLALYSVSGDIEEGQRIVYANFTNNILAAG